MKRVILISLVHYVSVVVTKIDIKSSDIKRFIGSALIIYKLHLNQNVKIDYKSNYPAIIS